MSDDIRGIRAYWEQFARHDPLWAILSDPEKRNRRWDIELFFQTGRREVSTLLYHLRRLGISVPEGKALDFGCGGGRATQALAEHFSRVVGIDIAETMIGLAEKVNRFPEQVRYVHNPSGDLGVFADREFDFVYSNIVLQHLEPKIAWGYLTEFLRVLRPGGLLVFQLPSHRRPREGNGAVVPRPMAEDAYRASLEVAVLPAGPMEPGSEHLLQVEVFNRSGHDWDCGRDGPLRLGNHWLSADGSAMLIQDDGRAPLPARLPAAAGCRLPLPIRIPPRPGHYLCEVDLVHEGVCWFRDKGSPAARVPVRAGSCAEPANAGAAGVPAAAPLPSAEEFYQGIGGESADPGPFPMHGIARGLIHDFFQDRGASVLDVAEDDHGGPEWIGYRYVVKKN